ncbi:MAG: hypothetical protein J6A01_12260, partial [Proteobacteria bacterium]|nr:hypothetical protein [Pseudomonadota bacterium]
AWYYLAKSYLDYFHDNGLSIYGNKRIQLPIPELYVIFTGNRSRKPKVLKLSNVFFQGRSCDIEVKFHMIYRGKKGSIIYQYITFCKVFSKQVELYGRRRKAIEEAIRICIQSNILSAYLKEREKEIMDIMTALFDQEEVTKSLQKMAKMDGIRIGKEDGIRIGKEDGIRIGKEDGIRIGKEGGIRQCILNGRMAGFTDEQLTQITGLSLDEVKAVTQEGDTP